MFLPYNEIKEIEIELLNNSKISKNDSKCFAKAKVLSTTKVSTTASSPVNSSSDICAIFS